MNINIYNKTGNKDLYLFFDYATSGSTKVTGFSNLTYIQPWASGKKKLTEPHECSFEYLNSGTFWYIITNETGASTIKNNPSIAMGTADPNWVGGFFELSRIAPTPEQKKEKITPIPYLDVTNVDQIGLFCGMEFPEINAVNLGRCGYGKTADGMISGIINACNLGDDTSAKVTIKGTDGKTYSKLWGPTVANVADQYNKIYAEYIKEINANGTVLNILSDVTKGSPHAGTQLEAFSFKGEFGEPSFDLPSGCPISKSDIVAWFKGKENGKTPADDSETYIFLTEDGLNPNTIASGNSSGGMYVYPAFEYADPKDQTKIKKGGWAENVSLNWTATGDKAVSETTCFQAAISSVIRNLIISMNKGYIGVTSGKENFTYGDPSTYASEENQQKYLNEWNNYITDNSDSYGMAYSDGAKAKVQFHPTADGTINCYVFAQDDKETINYWSAITPA
jgi:hypothetical protein